MHTALLTVALLAGSGGLDPQAGFDSTSDAAAAIGPTLRTGSLIFSSGDCLAVRVFTASPYTHVAAVVVNDEGECIVYDSTNGVGVRRQTLAGFLGSQATAQIHVHHPSRTLNDDETGTLAEYLESQVGRPYAIQHHLTGGRCEGLHCAEYVTDALMSIDLIQTRQPARVSPASLREGVTTHQIYSAGQSIQLARPEPQPQADGTCEQLWLDTKTCCSRCCRKLRGWFLCE